MGKELTIIMYHYVRNLEKTRFPDIKGLHIKDFKKQLEYLSSEYTFVTVEQCLEQLDGPLSDFPDNAALLTFDDGYLEHFTEVFPMLQHLKIQGSFFPPVQSTVERKALDVNKIHFILATESSKELLLEKLSQRIRLYRSDFNLLTPDGYYNKIKRTEHPYDPMNVIIFKRVLQRELPKRARKKIISDLFSEIVGISEDIFVEELYMKEKHLKCMIENGMFIGGHGYSHEWLNSLDKDKQENEIKKTKDFLDSVGANINNWVMCYPYGAYDESLIKILKQNDCQMAFTTMGEKAILSSENRFKLTRIDTNEVKV